MWDESTEVYGMLVLVESTIFKIDSIVSVVNSLCCRVDLFEFIDVQYEAVVCEMDYTLLHFNSVIIIGE